MGNNRDFKGIWIPRDIWLSKDLTLQEKVFLVEIDSLDQERGCFASNKHFQEFFGLGQTRVSLVIKSLIDKGFVRSKMFYKEGTQQIEHRVLSICGGGYSGNVAGGIVGMCKESNTINNTINNTIKKREVIEKIPSSPSQENELFPEIPNRKKKTMFKNCLLNEEKIWKEKFRPEIEAGIDVFGYIQKVSGWSDINTGKVRTFDGWTATVGNFMRSDKEKGKLIKVISQEKKNQMSQEALNYLNRL